jgi:hypothetical protein
MSNSALVKVVEVLWCGSADLWDRGVDGGPFVYPRVMVRREGSTSMWGGPGRVQ